MAFWIWVGKVWLDCWTGLNQWPTSNPDLAPRVLTLALSHSLTCAHLGNRKTKQSRNICPSHEQRLRVCVCVCVLFRGFFFLGRQNLFVYASHDIFIGVSGYACIFSWGFHSSVTCRRPLCLDMGCVVSCLTVLRCSCDFHFYFIFYNWWLISNPWPHSGPYIDCLAS